VCVLQCDVYVLQCDVYVLQCDVCVLQCDVYVLQSDHQSVGKGILCRSGLSSLFLICNVSFC